MTEELFREDATLTACEARVVALGTGQALDMARRGDADIVFVHDQSAEEKFVAEGFGLKRLAHSRQILPKLSVAACK